MWSNLINCNRLQAQGSVSECNKLKEANKKLQDENADLKKKNEQV